MSLLHSRLESDRNEKENISQQVEGQHFMPTAEEQDAASNIIRIISDRFSERLRNNQIEEIRDELTRAIKEECEKLKISYEQQKRVEKICVMTALGQGPIEEYLNDPEITEIIVQRYDNIVIERNGKTEPVDATFYSEAHLVTTIERIIQGVGRQINLTHPIADARLKDGSRVNATIPPISVDGATLTIRKFNNHALTGKDYIKLGSLSREMLYFIERSVKGRLSIFVSGGTGSGKTTLLNMMSGFIPNNELLITVEDTCELKLQQPNVRRMEVRESNNKEMMQVNQQVLVKAALRQRPDRIIVGETRDGSIVDLISAMSTGHEGSLSTVHANTPQNLCDVRIPILYSMNKDADFSEHSIAMQVSEAIQLIIQISRMPDGSRKITHISHVDGVTEDGKVNVADIFKYNRKTGVFEHTGYIPEKLIQTIEERGLAFDRRIFGMENN